MADAQIYIIFHGTFVHMHQLEKKWQLTTVHAWITGVLGAQVGYVSIRQGACIDHWRF